MFDGDTVEIKRQQAMPFKKIFLPSDASLSCSVFSQIIRRPMFADYCLLFYEQHIGRETGNPNINKDKAHHDDNLFTKWMCEIR